MSDERSHRFCRFHPVYLERDEGPVLAICECQFHDGVLESWTSPVTPTGETANELVTTLSRMIVAVRRWSPVPYEDLEPGMRFFPRAFEPSDDIARLRIMFVTIPL